MSRKAKAPAPELLAAAELLRSHGYRVLGLGPPDRAADIAPTYGLLQVLRRAENSRWGAAQYLCQCACGRQKVIAGVNLRSGQTKSCGCVGNQYNWRKVQRKCSNV